ncbi:MAG TPA: glycosyltransferase family 39 protein [Pyrinomonadaceae bacterium]|jgi:Gpi18-like mannosyltransferase|nr:glycosyltransferase family 39 protein [Pyrinomonadaceae bacterium]
MQTASALGPIIDSTKREDARGFRRGGRAYLAALIVFLASRLVVLLSIAFAARFVPQNPAGAFWNVNASWYRFLLRYDSGWYLTIIKFGYSYDGNDLVKHPVVFFPLYPLAAKVLTGAFGINEAVSVLLVSNISILIAILLAFKLIKDEYGHEAALSSIAFLSFFPASFFFSAGYTESLAFLLLISFFLLLKQEQYLLAAVCAALALATRATCIVLLPPLLWEIWRRYRREPKRLVLMAVACAMVATSGLWLYMLFLWTNFKSPLAFWKGQRAWLEGQAVSSNLFQVLTLRPFAYLGALFVEGPNPNTLDPWWFLSFLVLIILFRKRLPVSYTLFALGVLLLPYITLSGGLGFRSFTRYIILAFPVFIILGELMRKWTWAGLAVLGIFAATLFMYTAMFAQWYWAG